MPAWHSATPLTPEHTQQVRSSHERVIVFKVTHIIVARCVQIHRPEVYCGGQRIRKRWRLPRRRAQEGELAHRIATIRKPDIHVAVVVRLRVHLRN